MKTHELILVKEYPSGAQQWNCLSCSYSIIVMKENPGTFLDLRYAEDPEVEHVRKGTGKPSHVMELLDDVNQIWECPQCGFAVEFRGNSISPLFNGIKIVHVILQGENITLVDDLDKLD